MHLMPQHLHNNANAPYNFPYWPLPNIFIKKESQMELSKIDVDHLTSLLEKLNHKTSTGVIKKSSFLNVIFHETDRS